MRFIGKLKEGSKARGLAQAGGYWLINYQGIDFFRGLKGEYEGDIKDGLIDKALKDKEIIVAVMAH